MFGLIMPLCNRMFCCIFGWYFYIEIRLKYEKNILLSSSRAFSSSTPVDNSEATWKEATKCNKACFCSKFCPGRFPPLFPVNPVRSFCCNYDRGKAIRILDTPLMVMRKLELCDNGVKLFLKNIYYFNELALLDQLICYPLLLHISIQELMPQKGF